MPEPAKQQPQTHSATPLRIAVTQMYTFLTRFEPAVLTTRVATHPGAYARILNVLCKLTDAAIKCERQRRDDECQDGKLPQMPATLPLNLPRPSRNYLQPLAASCSELQPLALNKKNKWPVCGPNG